MREPVVGRAPIAHPRWRRVGYSTFKHTIVWKDIPGFPEYEVSEYGDVRHGTRYLKPERTCGNGRKRFSLTRDGKVFRLKAAQLVALAFIGPKPFAKAEVCHNDGFEHNNHYPNLRWDTRSSNVVDAIKHKFQKEQHSGFPVRRTRSLSVAAALFLGDAKKRAAK